MPSDFSILHGFAAAPGATKNSDKPDATELDLHVSMGFCQTVPYGCGRRDGEPLRAADQFKQRGDKGATSFVSRSIDAKAKQICHGPQGSVHLCQVSIAVRVA